MAYHYRYRRYKGSVADISITFKILLLNLLFFLLVVTISYGNPTFIKYIALTPIDIIAGNNLWTLITNMFMHADIFHLFMNMVSLMFLGSFLERVIGRRRFLIFYLSAGIFAGLFFVFFAWLFAQNLESSAVGASGAIFGIAGMLAVLTPRLPVYIMFIPIAMPMWFAVILILSLLWFISAISGLPIGNTAHLGGLIAGLAYGFYLRKKYPRKVYLLNRMLTGM
jgi:membrane associated rhomboid family serine protease